jgi:hypothetical protein
MRSLTAPELLDVWEAGAAQSLAQRALLLLAVANPDRSYEALAQQPLGQRDAQLLTLREWLFGPQLISVANCPNCGEHLQLTLSTRELLTTENATAETMTLNVDEYTIRYRLPASTDLFALAQCETVADSRQLLLQRCVQTITRADQSQPIETVPAAVLEVIEAHMAQADPQADLQLDLDCPTCHQHWLAAFDIAAFLWKEIDSWARRIVGDIHIIAMAYGWSETDILALSASRRQMYLDLIGNA